MHRGGPEREAFEDGGELIGVFDFAEFGSEVDCMSESFCEEDGL